MPLSRLLRPWAAAAGLALAACLLAASGPPAAPAGAPQAARVTAAQRALSPFGAIHSPLLPDYDHYQLKFTFLAPQQKTRPSLGGVSAARAGGYSHDEFVPFQRGYWYGNDVFTLDTLVLTAAEFKGYVDAIAARPFLQDTLAVPYPNISLMILRGYGPASLCWEHLAPDVAQTDTLLQLLHDNLTNPAAQDMVDHVRHYMARVRR